MGGLSLPHLLIVLAIVLLLFGSRRLRSLGSDLGDAIKAFRQATGEAPPVAPVPLPPARKDQA